MNFGNLAGMGGMAENFLSTPEGQAAVKQFLGSSQGMDLLKSFAGTPDGQKAIMTVLPMVLDGLNLPQPVKDMIKSSIPTS
jgi:hypothetical protein